jgi:protein TonB
MTAQLRPWQLSFLFHAGLAFVFVLLLQLKLPFSDVIEVPVEIIEPSKDVQNLTEVKERPKVVLRSVNEPMPESAPKREVFGANRNSYTDDSLGSEGVEAKRGNTLAKEADKTVLQDSDADALPTPTEEYLVSQMPTVLTEVRPAYPKEAREKELEGSVVMDILIDAEGKVRDISVVDGDPLFRPGAVEAMRKFVFRPAKVDGKSVAVRIRYSLKFQLEY